MWVRIVLILLLGIKLLREHIYKYDRNVDKYEEYN